MVNLLPLSTDLLPYLTIPLVAALVGWGTNWVAINLMFYPLEFKGYRPLRLGWQGVIPSKARKMARVVVQKGLKSLASISEVYAALDRDKLISQFTKEMEMRLEEYVQDVMEKENAQLWSNTPEVVKRRIIGELNKQLPDITRSILDELESHIEGLFDLEKMVEDRLSDDKALLCQIFQEAGREEFRFIVKSGFLLGFVFGCVQMLVWWYLSYWWVLPLFGIIVGYATNDIALRMIFKPLNPVHIGPITIQGLFLKRQKAVTEVLCRITTEKVITVNNILTAILTGPKSERTRRLMHKKIGMAVDQMAAVGVGGVGKPVTQAVFGLRGYATLKSSACETAIEYLSSELEENNAFSSGQAPIINGLLRERMEQLSPEAFQGILRPAFQEDELTLILIGAVLGGAVGFLQLLWLYDQFTLW